MTFKLANPRTAAVAPLALDQVPEDMLELCDIAEEAMGFLSNDVLTMVRIPPVLNAMVELAPVLYAPGAVSLELKNLVTFMTSSAAGCMYCSSHQMLGSSNVGVSDEKIEAIWEYNTSPLFDDAERAALRVAHHAGLVPNAVTDDDMASLLRHFTDEQVLEIVAVIAMFGFLNRWNDTLGTTLERQPSAIRERLQPVALGDGS